MAFVVPPSPIPHTSPHGGRKRACTTCYGSISKIDLLSPPPFFWGKRLHRYNKEFNCANFFRVFREKKRGTGKTAARGNGKCVYNQYFMPYALRMRYFIMLRINLKMFQPIVKGAVKNPATTYRANLNTKYISHDVASPETILSGKMAFTNWYPEITDINTYPLNICASG
jgi:hypothetical protein